MIRFRLFPIFTAGLALGAAAFAEPVQADVTIVSSVAMSMPGMFKSLPPAIIESLKKSGANMLDGTPMLVTMNVSGKKTRVDMGTQVILTDAQAKTTTVLDKGNHTVMQMPYSEINDPKKLTSFLKGVEVSVQDTGETKTIMGHVTEHYIVDETDEHTGNIQSKVDVWAAADMPVVPEMTVMNGPASTAQAVAWSRITGTPLVTAMSSISPKFGRMTFRMEVKSISSQAVAPSLFMVPSDYKQISAPTIPTGSFPIGHGPAQ